MTNLSIPNNPAKWHTSITGNSKITINNDGTVNIKSNKGDTAYIYMPVQVISGDSININTLISNSSGASVIYSNEDEFSSNVFNRTYCENIDFQYIEINHTSKLNKDVAHYIYVKIGSDSSIDTDCNIAFIKVKAISSIGTMRDVAFASILIKNGVASINESWVNSGISKLELFDDRIDIYLDKIISISSSVIHKNTIPLIFANIAFSNPDISVVIDRFDQYTNCISIKYYNSLTNSIISNLKNSSIATHIRVSCV